MSKKSRRIYSMSPSEINSIGHYYLHNNPKNFLESLKGVGITSLKKMEEIVDKAMIDLMKSHSNDLSRLVDQLMKKSKSTSRGDLLEQMKMFMIGKRSEDLFIRAFDDLKIHAQIARFAKGMDKETIDKSVKAAEKSIKAFLNEVVRISQTTLQKSSPLFFALQPLQYGLAGKVGRDDIQTGVNEVLESDLINKLKEFEAQSQKAYRDAEGKYDNRELYALFNKLAIGDEENIRGGYSTMLFGFLNEDIFLELILQDMAKKFFGEYDLDVEKVSSDYHGIAVADLSLKFNDLNVGFSLKHSDVDKSLNKTYATPLSYDTLFGDIGDGRISQIFQYIKNNVYFLKGLGNKGASIDTLKRIERNALKLRIISRSFDGFYRYSKNKDNFELEYQTRQGQIFNKENVRIASSVFFVLNDEIFYTDEVIEYLTNLATTGDGDSKNFISEALESSFETPSGPGNKKRDEMEKKKRAWISSNRRKRSYSELGAAFKTSMDDVVEGMGTRSLFYKKARLNIHYDLLVNEMPRKI